MKRLKHLQNLMVAGMQDANSHVAFHVSLDGRWQYVVSTGLLRVI